MNGSGGVPSDTLAFLFSHLFEQIFTYERAGNKCGFGLKLEGRRENVAKRVIISSLILIKNKNCNFVSLTNNLIVSF